MVPTKNKLFYIWIRALYIERVRVKYYELWSIILKKGMGLKEWGMIIRFSF